MSGFFHPYYTFATYSMCVFHGDSDSEVRFMIVHVRFYVLCVLSLLETNLNLCSTVCCQQFMTQILFFFFFLFSSLLRIAPISGKCTAFSDLIFVHFCMIFLISLWNRLRNTLRLLYVYTYSAQSHNTLESESRSRGPLPLLKFKQESWKPQSALIKLEGDVLPGSTYSREIKGFSSCLKLRFNLSY